MASAKAPYVNLSDIPELMPGAQPSANPAQREEFEQRCRKLHEDEVQERRAEAEVAREASGTGSASAYSELEAMFPNLDAALVRAIRADAPSAQSAIETLLLLSSASAEPVAGSVAESGAPSAPASLPPLDMQTESYEKFPSLGGHGQHHSEQGKEEDLGSAWRDRAKAAADIPAPQPTARPAAAWPAQARRKPGTRRDDEGEEASQPLTDYQFRQQAGQRRAKHRAQFGRGHGRGAGTRGAGAAAQGSAPRPGGAAGSDSESEASEASSGC